MHEENLQSIDDMQNIEIQPIASIVTDENHPEPVDEQELEPVEEQGLEVVVNQELESVEEQELESVEEQEVEPVEEQEVEPIEQELEVAENQELDPVEEPELEPVEEHEFEPMEEPELESVEEQELAHEEEQELVHEEDQELNNEENQELETDSEHIDIEDEISDVDYAGFTRKEMMDHLRKLLVLGEIETIRRDIDILKYHFYRKLKAEEELKRAEYIENGGSDDDYVFEEDEQELILKNLLNRYRDIRQMQNAQMEAEKQSNLEKKVKIIEELKELTNSTESIGGTFQQFRDLQNRWRSIGLVPQNEVKKSLGHLSSLCRSIL